MASATPGPGDAQRPRYWQGSSSNPYLDIPGDALEGEEPMTRRRPTPIPSPAPPPRAQRQSHVREQTRQSSDGTRQVGSVQQVQQVQQIPQTRHRPQANANRARRSADRTQLAQGRPQAARQARASAANGAASSAPSPDGAQAARPRTPIATPLPPRPTIRGASMAGTDRLARAEAARRALDTNAYFLDDSRQPRKGRGAAQAQASQRPIAPYKLHFWRWFRTLPIVVMGLFAAASIVVSLGLFGIDKWLYPVDYNDAILAMADAYDVDPLLVSAIIRTESGWDPEAVSRMGAVGLMQLLPSTASDLAASGEVDASRYDPTNLLDPETNIAYGTAYLRDCLSSTDDLDQAIAAYNAGIAAAQGWAQTDTPFEEAIQYPETTAYLERVRENLDRYNQTYSEGFPTEDAQ